MSRVEGRRSGRWWLAWVVAAAVVACAGGLAAGRFIVSPREVAARSQAPDPTLITADVVFQRIADVIIARGDVAPAASVNLGYGGLVKEEVAAPDVWTGMDEGGGGAVLTGAFVEVGDEVAEGDVPVEVAYRPLVVLQGEVPLTRDLKPGMEGRDVAQLQAALDRLGFYSGDGAGVFDAATKAAVKRLYARVGYPAPATDGGAGDDAEAVVAGQAAVDAARAAVKAAEAGVAAADSELAGARDQERAARRALEDLRTARKAAAKAREKAEAKAVEQWNRARAAQTASPAAPTGDGGSIADLTLKQAVAEALDGVAPAPGESEFAAAKDAVRAGERGVAGAQAGLAAAEDAVGEAKKQVGSAQAALGRLEARIGAVAPMAELAFAPVLPAFATAVASEVGFAAPAVLVALTPDSLEVRVGGMASVDALMLAEGLETELELPDGSVATGAVSQIVPETGGQTGSAVSITPDEPLDFALAGANLKVTFTAAQSAGEVLAVPQGALSSQPSGDLSVLLVGPADPATGEPVLTRVQVTTGVSGEGLVEVAPVEPGALEPGAKVVVSG